MIASYIIDLFIGTAGVWRISAIEEAGGWKDRTTVEDMDLAVRASLKGWKFVYVGDIKVLNLPLFLLVFEIRGVGHCNLVYVEKTNVVFSEVLTIVMS